MSDRRVGATLIDYHDCIKNGDVVTIVADVIESRRGPIVSLHAHGQRCKKSRPGGINPAFRVFKE